MPSTTVRHPIFARLYDKLSVVAEAAGSREHRAELLAGLSGRVIEVGAGTGLNFAHYPSEVSEVVAVEPEPHLRAKAVVAATSATVAITVIDATAGDLPHGEATFDAAVYSLVLCSVADPAAALAEAHRVVKPGLANCDSMNTSRPTPRGSHLSSADSTMSGPCSPAAATPHGTHHSRSSTPASISNPNDGSGSNPPCWPSQSHRTSSEPPDDETSLILRHRPHRTVTLPPVPRTHATRVHHRHQAENA